MAESCSGEFHVVTGHALHQQKLIIRRAHNMCSNYGARTIPKQKKKNFLTAFVSTFNTTETFLKNMCPEQHRFAYFLYYFYKYIKRKSILFSCASENITKMLCNKYFNYFNRVAVAVRDVNIFISRIFMTIMIIYRSYSLYFSEKFWYLRLKVWT